MKLKEQNSSGFLYVCLFLTLWPIVQPSSHTFGSVSYTGFLTEERRKEKGAHFMKVMFVLIVPKKRSANRKLARWKDIQSQRKTTKSFTGKELRVHNTLLKRLWTCIELWFAIFVGVWVHNYCANVSVSVGGGVRSYSETVLSCVASSCRQLLRMMGSGWASVLKTQSSSGRRSSSEKSRYKYLSVSERKKLCCMLSWLTVVV